MQDTTKRSDMREAFEAARKAISEAEKRRQRARKSRAKISTRAKLRKATAR